MILAVVRGPMSQTNNSRMYCKTVDTDAAVQSNFVLKEFLYSTVNSVVAKYTH